MRILVTGGTGYLGSALLHHLHTSRRETELAATYFSKTPDLDFASFFHLDLCDGDSIEQVVSHVRPDVIVHTAVQMQGDLEALLRVNARGTAILARIARGVGARLISLSTDLVFDGSRGNYREEDLPNPVVEYARSKFEAEGEVLASGVKAVIVRTSLIYGFAPVDPRTRAVMDGDMPRLFTDERRSPIWVENLCAALTELGEGDYTGILHVAGAEPLSRYEFGIKLVRALGGDESRLIATRSAESGLIRPLDCTLDCSRARRILKTKLLAVDEVTARL